LINKILAIRILTELKLLSDPVGVTVLSAGIGNDVVGWILLALCVALTNSATGLIALYTILCAVGWILVLVFLYRPCYIWICRKTGSFENGPTKTVMAITLVSVLISAWVTDVIGIHPIFGGFLVSLPSC
jgi:Kef-type K+ transport system membrane component KefB